MALVLGTVFEMRASATTANVNGAGFNPSATFPITDLTTDANTGNTASPVVSSASYNFDAGDSGAWLYISAGTNWTVGWYPIASVASNKATLNAAVGAAILSISGSGLVTYNTVAGCATVGTPTSGTGCVDYTQQDAADFTQTNLSTSGAGATTITSASAGFTKMHVGHLVHITAGTNFTAGWYEITTFTDSSNVVVDRTPTSAGAGSGGTFYVGGAGRLNALEDAFFEMIPAGSRVFFKAGTYTTGATISVASTNSTTTDPSIMQGYTTLRGDNPTNPANMPLIAFGSNASTFGSNQLFKYINFTTTATNGVVLGNNGILYRCKALNSSTTSGRNAFSCSGATSSGVVFCEAISQNGVAINANVGSGRLYGNYIHDSDTGITNNNTQMAVVLNVFEANRTAALTVSSSAPVVLIFNNTIYGREGQIGIGANLSTGGSSTNRIFNNIFYGLTTGITVASPAAHTNLTSFNDFFNNGTNVSNITLDATDLTVDPGLAGATQITGTTATTSGSVLTQAGGDFSSVTDNVDFLHVLSGTGVTTGGYLITSHTGTTLTVNNTLGTSSAGNVNYFVTTGHNFNPGINVKAKGSPGSVVAGLDTTSYLDIGAVQRPEPSGATAVMPRGPHSY
jgi:hypothetical protein